MLLLGVVSVQHGQTHFEGRSTETERWDENFLRNALLIDDIDLPLTQSYSATHDSFTAVDILGGPMKGGLLLPWNELAGGMTISNVTFVNHKVLPPFSPSPFQFSPHRSMFVYAREVFHPRPQ